VEALRGLWYHHTVLAFYAVIFTTFAINAGLIVFLVWAFYSPRFSRYRIDAGGPIKLSLDERIRNVATSSAVSLVAVLGSTYLYFDRLFHQHPTSVATILLQALLILVLYDFAYYALHRGMHHKKIMRFVHGVHHRAKSPSALESFFLHPAELLAGLFLLMASTWLVGPVHVYAFGAAFFVYSTLNILIHSGLDFGHPLLAPIDFLSRKHHVHHFNDFSKNFSSLTPLPDLLFRSAG
jgi:sterol desaturase/sphingolipid hydroxylase (fatty acid hydroxylase superfamily)